MSDESWEDNARRELGPMVASTAFVITLDPGGEIDPKVALETGYAVLLDKPIVLLVTAGTVPTPGLVRIAAKVIQLTQPLDSAAGQLALQAGLAGVEEIIRARGGFDAS